MGLSKVHWAGQLKLIGPVSRGPLTVTAIIVALLQAAGFSPETHVKVAVKVPKNAEVIYTFYGRWCNFKLFQL